MVDTVMRDSVTIKNYKTKMKELLNLYFPDYNTNTFNEALDYSINKRYKDEEISIHNNYKKKAQGNNLSLAHSLFAMPYLMIISLNCFHSIQYCALSPPMSFGRVRAIVMLAQPMEVCSLWTGTQTGRICIPMNTPPMSMPARARIFISSTTTGSVNCAIACTLHAPPACRTGRTET